MFRQSLMLLPLALLASCGSSDRATSQSESEAVPTGEGMASSPDFESDRQSPAAVAPGAGTPANGDGEVPST